MYQLIRISVRLTAVHLPGKLQIKELPASRICHRNVTGNDNDSSREVVTIVVVFRRLIEGPAIAGPSAREHFAGSHPACSKCFCAAIPGRAGCFSVQGQGRIDSRGDAGTLPYLRWDHDSRDCATRHRRRNRPGNPIAHGALSDLEPDGPAGSGSRDSRNMVGNRDETKPKSFFPESLVDSAGRRNRRKSIWNSLRITIEVSR
jgi:hypothetical protein